MKKFITTLIAPSNVIATIFLSVSFILLGIESYTTIFAEVHKEVVVENKTLVVVQPTTNIKTDSIFEGELPPIEETTLYPVVMTAAHSEEAEPEILNEYIVQDGDSLSKIATMFLLDIELLKKWNNLTSDTIQVGQTLSVNGQVEPTPEQIAAIEAANQNNVRVQQNLAQSQLTNSADESATTEETSRLIAIAHQYLGAPYVYGGTTPNGFDCSGYVSYVFIQAGKLSSNLDTIGLYNMSQKVSTPQVGDLVFFSGTYRAGISHVGIYLGNNLMINASGNRVKISNIYDSYWGKYFTGFGRI